MSLSVDNLHPKILNRAEIAKSVCWLVSASVTEKKSSKYDDHMSFSNFVPTLHRA